MQGFLVRLLHNIKEGSFFGQNEFNSFCRLEIYW